MAGHAARRHRRFSAAARRASAADRLPDYPGLALPCPARTPKRWRPLSPHPLENQFGAIPGVSQMTSSSTLGTTQITVQFDLDRNIDAAAQDIQSAIDATGVKLPHDLPAPFDLQESEPRRFGDPHPRDSLRRVAHAPRWTTSRRTRSPSRSRASPGISQVSLDKASRNPLCASGGPS